MQMYDRYEKLTGASAPNMQSVEISSDEEKEKTPQEIQEELLKLTGKLSNG